MVGMHFAWIGGLFFVLLVAAVLIVGVVLLATRGGATRTAQAGPEAPLDILARRFASGEISADEYQKARDLLKGEPPPSP